MNRKQRISTQPPNPPMAWHAGGGRWIRSNATMNDKTLDITVTPFGAIRFILATPDYDDGEPSLDQDDMQEIATWLSKAQAEYNAAIAERDAAIAAANGCGDALTQAEAERDAAHAEADKLREQVDKARQLPQQIMDAIEQYDFDGERWFIDDIRAIIECEAGYPSRDDSLWFTGAEWQGLLDTAIGGECAALRAALVSLLDGKSEFDIEYDTGMAAADARRIIDLAYNRQ